MIDALTDLRDSLENRRLQEITAAMIESIQGGKALSEAMRDFPYVFSTVFVNLVRAGEQSGTLTRVLRHMIDNLKWQDEQAAHTKRLLIYPVVVAVVVGGAMFSLMVFVVPELLKFVQSMGQELPLHTEDPDRRLRCLRVLLAFFSRRPGLGDPGHPGGDQVQPGLSLVVRRAGLGHPLVRRDPEEAHSDAHLDLFRAHVFLGDHGPGVHEGGRGHRR